ncbi:MAG: DUF1992 domain-containing protein [Acidihalobacter sp.]
MDPVDAIAERRIREAIERRELDGLPGAGRPLRLDDDAHVPPELRAAYRLLKNAGFVPPELQLRRDISEAEALIAAATEPTERGRALRRLEMLRLQLSASGRGDLRLEEAYYQDVCRRFDAPQPSSREAEEEP